MELERDAGIYLGRDAAPLYQNVARLLFGALSFINVLAGPIHVGCLLGAPQLKQISFFLVFSLVIFLASYPSVLICDFFPSCI